MKIEDVQNCSFQNWYFDFQKVTMKSIILPLPDGFSQYMLKDGIVLPQSSNLSYEVDQNSSDESDSETDWTNADIEEAESPYFPDFDEQLEKAIENLGGKVFPKLNWSSPRDASWIGLNASLNCFSVHDIYLLLKSSNFIIHDLTDAFKDCEDYIQNEDFYPLCQPSKEFYLVLRKWIEVDTSGEYRCFVKNNSLIGICQREARLYFGHIGMNKSSIIEDIIVFFQKNIQFKFPSSSYVFDVYRRKEKNVQLLDFNPFGRVTDSLLFSWEELDQYIEIQDGIPEFRYVDENLGVQPNTLSYHAIPWDIVDINEGNIKLVDLIKEKMDEERKIEKNSDDEDVSVEK